MPRATSRESGRRYRGLSAEERRADQRERLVRAAIERVRGARLPPHVGRRHRAQRAHEPHRVLRVLRQPRRRDVRRAASVAARRCSTPCAQRSCASRPGRRAHRGRRHRVRRATSSPIRPPRAILLLEGIGTSPEVNALRSRVRARGRRPHPRHLGRVRPRGGRGARTRAAIAVGRVRHPARVDGAPRRDRPARRGAGARARARHRGRADASTPVQPGR